MPVYSEEDFINATKLIGAIREEMSLGTKYFNRSGGELSTLKGIVTTIRDEGKVTAEPTPKRQHLYRQIVAEQGLVLGGIGEIIDLKKP